jgi:hypothetical protein
MTRKYILRNPQARLDAVRGEIARLEKARAKREVRIDALRRRASQLELQMKPVLSAPVAVNP